MSADAHAHVKVELQNSSGHTVAFLSVPKGQFQQELSRTLEPCVLISPEGLISASLEEVAQEFAVNKVISIDQAIVEAISPDMLEDEPNIEQMLSKFRDRLLKSLEHVEQTIASLPKD
jgi:hypothetical protein